MRKIALFFACMSLLAAPGFSEVVVSSMWTSVVHTIANDMARCRIAVESNMIAVISGGYHDSGDFSQYWFSTNDGAAWSAKVNLGGWNDPSWLTFGNQSFFLKAGDPFGIGSQGYVFYGTNAGRTWRTNFFIPPDHRIIGGVGAYDPATTNLHVFYAATNSPPLDPTPSTNIRYAVYAKSSPGPGWDLPVTNIVLGDWPSTNGTSRGAAAFRDPVTGRFRSVRGYASGPNSVAHDPWLCVITNGGGLLIDMNTPIPMDGVNPYVAVDTDGTIYMVHVSNESSLRRGTNLVFTAFRYDEGSGLSFVTNEVIASGAGAAPDWHFVCQPCIALGVNGEVIVAYLAGGDGSKLIDVRIMVRDRHGRWCSPVTVASGDSDTPGVEFPGAGVVTRTDGGYLGGLDMAVVWSEGVNYVYLYYGQYRGSLASLGANTRNGVVHKFRVYHPPPPRGTIVSFK